MPIIETANRKPRPQHAVPPPPEHTIIASTKLPPRICGSILKALIPQICFLRAQIPCPLDVLEKHRRRQQENGGRIGRTREMSMRAERWLAAKDRLNDAIDTIFLESEVKEVVLIFGSSMISYKEMYRIKFHSDTSSGSSEDPQESVRRRFENNAVQAAMRYLVFQMQEQWQSKPIPPSRLWVCFLSPPTPPPSCEVLTPKWNYEPRPPRKGRTLCNLTIGLDLSAPKEGGNTLVTHEVVGLPTNNQDDGGEKENESPDKRSRSQAASPKQKDVRLQSLNKKSKMFKLKVDEER